MFDKRLNKVVNFLKKNSNNGLSITELVKVSKLSRHVILIALAKLEGANRVHIREVGMAKIYFLKEEVCYFSRR